ncbi:hypothetical protein ACTWQB_01990 [Piscibacillus sp. B03]|uniref:hypothetical protein n=1 Tax=Piscibacillus sp. B03 TaxID=3457430 RepID=UPI003FCD6EE0
MLINKLNRFILKINIQVKSWFSGLVKKFRKNPEANTKAPEGIGKVDINRYETVEQMQELKDKILKLESGYNKQIEKLEVSHDSKAKELEKASNDLMAEGLSYPDLLERQKELEPAKEELENIKQELQTVKGFKEDELLTILNHMKSLKLEYIQEQSQRINHEADLIEVLLKQYEKGLNNISSIHNETEEIDTLLNNGFKMLGYGWNQEMAGRLRLETDNLKKNKIMIHNEGYINKKLPY